MSDSVKLVQKAIRVQARELQQKLIDQSKELGLELVSNENGVPVPKDFPQALESIAEMLTLNERLFLLVKKLEELLPKKDSDEESLTLEEFQAFFLTGNKHEDMYDSMFGMSPPGIALIALDGFMKDTNRFDIIDPNSIEQARFLSKPYSPPKLTHANIEVAGKLHSVPVSSEFWVFDKKLGEKFIVSYGPTPQGGIAAQVLGNYEKEEKSIELIKDLKMAILQSPLIRGQIIEMQGGDNFTVVDIGDQPFPVIDPTLKHELETNVINLFNKEEEFKKYGLPLKRSVILAGPPGCGKTMIERWLAAQVRGKVTTIWVTAKSIRNAEDVQAVFEIARKLSPAMVVMEDLDLISGTRNGLFGNNGTGSLGEMLNQLDGLTNNESLVLIGSTNSVSSLDAALSDRPGRFDRIYQVGCPNGDLAKTIGQNYLRARGVSEEIIESLSLKPIMTGEFTGAQLVEIVKGAIFEAIQLDKPVSDRMIASSCRGLEEQRRLIKKQ